MRIYSLTQLGQSVAHTPTANMTNGWKIIYFLKRHGNRATDAQIIQSTGIGSGELQAAMRKLTSGEHPIVTMVS